MIKEEDVKIKILREARDLPHDKGLCYHDDRIVNEVALELIKNGFVIGSESEYGTAIISGIRESGTRYLENQRLHRKVLGASKKILFVLYSISLLIIGYILNLHSVKSFFSEIIGGFLK
jgi:hypothetical protein